MQKQQPLSAPKDVRRYFVSLEESGQICMLACMLGKSREIFFPKLEEKQMMSFDRIAIELLKGQGYTVLECGSEEEAVDEAEKLEVGSIRYIFLHQIHQEKNLLRSFIQRKRSLIRTGFRRLE